MKPQSLISEDAQIQRRAQGTWQGPVCSFPRASSMPSTLPAMGQTVNTCSVLPLSQNSLTLSLCLLEHG